MLELHVKNKQTKDAESKTFIQNTTKTEQTNGKLQIKKMVSEQQRFQPNRTVAERQCEASLTVHSPLKCILQASCGLQT